MHSDLGLCRLSRHFWQATGVRNFRMFTIFIHDLGLWVICMPYLLSANLLKNELFKKKVFQEYHQSALIWIQVRPEVLSGQV